ncbi:MAG: helix-turn-helix domain-containing protein [Alphaproteobacteria bacterium]|nr:helix-turn-helix domain-containing protein [Alphaproteobacteria bacterium]
MVTSQQIRAARAYLGWSQKILAEKAEISVPTIKRLELNDLEKTSFGNVQKVMKAIENAGIKFIERGIQEES